MYPELSFIAAFYYYKRHLFMHFILNCQDCWETGPYNAIFKTIQQGCESTRVHSQAQKHTVCVLIMSVPQNLISHRLKRASGKPAVKLAAQTVPVSLGRWDAHHLLGAVKYRMQWDPVSSRVAPGVGWWTGHTVLTW